MKKMIYFLLGMCTFALGTVGIFLPLLPTTVFYLLSGFFWLRSSDTHYQRLLASDKYQRYVVDPFIKKQMTTRGLIRLFSGMFIIFAIPFLILPQTILRLIIGIVYCCHVIGLTWHLKWRKPTS